MFIEGKKGQLTIFYKEILIAGYPIGQMSYHDYQLVANDLIIDSMRSHKRNMREQILAYRTFCNAILFRKLKKKYISEDDYRMFLACSLALVKLKILDEDDIVFISDRKRPKRIFTSL
tara:strand:- start:341 stop:694 length:354 start_codon:yes stop_codon:yes gene_type:complete